MVDHWLYTRRHTHAHLYVYIFGVVYTDSNEFEMQAAFLFHAVVMIGIFMIEYFYPLHALIL